jgi:hypothetical protein
MDKKNLFIIGLVCYQIFLPASFADNCPSINQLGSYLANGWKAYDSNDGTTLSAKRQAKFLQVAQQFALAEWTVVANPPHSGAIHCYYRDKTGANLESYLGKESFIPLQTKNYWYSVSGYMQCAASATQCQFAPNLLQHQPHLAKNS